MTEAKCPYCGEELVADEMVEDLYTDDGVDEKWSGWCPNCDRLFTWWEQYKRVKIFNMVEEDEE